MADTWSEAVNNGYTYYPNRFGLADAWLTFVGGWNRDGTQDSAHQRELALAACAEMDSCFGVEAMGPGIFPRAGGWTYAFVKGKRPALKGSPEAGVSGETRTDRNFYMKKPGITKPSTYKAGVGILPQNGDTKVKICQDANGNTNCGNVGRSFYPRDMPNAGSANSVVVPLGLKAGLNLNFFDGPGDESSQKDGSRVGSCGNLKADGGAKVWNESNAPGACFKNGWNPGNRPDGIIVSQVPINMADLNVFNGLVSAGVGPNDAKLLRAGYCAQLSTIDSNQCKLFSSDPGNNFDFDVMKTNICNQDRNWASNPTCVAAVNNAQKTGSQAGKRVRRK